MKDLIIQALNDAIIVLDKRTPTTKTKMVEVNIEDVSPIGIIKFMQENNIPENAFFSTNATENSGFTVNPILCYDITIPTTDADKLKFRNSAFTMIAFKEVFNLLTTNGFKRVGFNSGLLKDYIDTTVYKMFIENDFDRLVKYYSLSFIKIQ